MKTLVITVMLLSAFVASHAQFKGVPFDEAVTVEEVMDYTEEELYNVLIKIDEDSVTAYTYVYEVKSKGYYDALKKLSGILEANNISGSADIEDSYFESHVDESDYNEVVHILRMESGWIERTWYAYDDSWKIMMIGNDEAIVVVVANYKGGRFERERQEQPGSLNNQGRDAFGNQGVTNGSPDADRYDTGGGFGDGISFGGLGSRSGSLPKPNMAGCDITQKMEVKVEIQVDRDGKVVSAVMASSTFSDNCIHDMVIEAAKKSRFSPDQSASFKQTGWIKYIIVP